METLVVLTALVCGAIAAPALQEQGIQDLKTTQDIVDLTTREKKSPAGSHGFTVFTETGTSPGHSVDFESFPESARSFFKKPIIVKKKVGYHLYRDSDEEKEQASSRESCNERVKVKLCDEKIMPKSTDSMKSTVIEDVDHIMSEDEMKHSLRMAKEALANLERDLNRIEQHPGVKMNQRKQDAMDAQIHEDIDTARQVLEHIHRNFGDVDSMSIHTTSSKDADSLQNVHLTIAKTEEEKMAQWKEAIKNIQRNAEIVRNIEDSFKSSSHGINDNNFHMPEMVNFNENLDSQNEFVDRRSKNTDLLDSNSDKSKPCTSNLHNAKPSIKEAEEKRHSMDDMTAFASTVVESNTDANSAKLLRNDNHGMHFEESETNKNEFETLKETNHENLQVRDNLESSAQFHTTDLTQQDVKSMRANEQGHDLETEKSTINENNLNMRSTSPTVDMKSTEIHEAKSAADCLHNHSEKSFNHDHNDKKHSEDTSMLTKSAFNTDSLTESNTNVNDKQDLHTEQRQPLRTTNNVAPTQSFDLPRNNENDAMTGETQHVEHAVLPLDNTETKHLQAKMGQAEATAINSARTSHPDQETFPMNLKTVQTEMTSAMKTVENDKTTAQPSGHTLNMRWSSDQAKDSEHTAMANGPNQFRAVFNNRPSSFNTHFMNGPHMMPSMNSASNFDASTTHSHIHSSQFNRMRAHMTHGKAPEMDSAAQTNFNTNMMDHSGNFGHDMHWKPHESARTAYGPIASGSTGASPSAVGLFPNANVGGCSIPLLLSCSPQVTSGSLAKALPAGYASPAYRTEDDFTFFPNKREIKRTNEIGATATKMSSTMKQKAITISDTKQ